ncbi:MAG TPA: hypothetical protein VEJ63_15520, partial [Planctomycetota bacterium]|nr:hypothetical protein [Planctomycetota bacterium]
SATNVNVRTGPGTEHSVVVTLKTADYIRARAEQGGWLEIDWPRNSALWVPRESVTLNESGETRSAVAKTALPLRLQGTRTAAPIVRLNAGDSVMIVGEVNGWYRVEAPPSAKAYISSKYVLLGVQPPLSAHPAVKSPAAEKIIAAVPTATAEPAKPTAAPVVESATAPAQHAIEVSAPAAPAKPVEPAAPAEKIEVAAIPPVEQPQAPSAIEPPAPSASETPDAVKRDLSAEIEETRRRLMEAPPPSSIVPEEPAKAPAAHASTAPLIEEDEPSTKTVSLTKEFELNAIETERQKLLAERAELEAQNKRLLEETKAAEEAARLQALKLQEQLETSRREAEAKQKAEADEQARKAAEAKRIEELESARREAEAKQRAEAEEQARKEAEEKAKSNAEPAGTFEEPTSVAPAAPAAPAEVKEAVVLAALPEPRTSKTPTEVAPPPAVIFEDEPSVVVADKGADARIDFTPEAVKNVRSKFIVPGREPVKPGTRAEVIEMAETVPLPEETPAAAPAIEQKRAAPSRPLKTSKPVIEQFDLPVPAGEAPAAHRLNSSNSTLVRNVDQASGRVTSETGTLKRVDWTPVNGAAYALVENGRVVHYLTAREEMDLSAFVDRGVQVTGTPVVGASSEHSVLEVRSISARE